MKKICVIALLLSLSLVFAGCAGSSVGTISWLGQGLEAGHIEAIQLTDLNGDLVRELDPSEYEAIVQAINNAKEDESPYILMLAGYIMTVKLPDGEIRFTSYGSETNVVAAVTVGEETKSKHLVCPEIAQILIEDLEQDIWNNGEPEA
ncbi:MAG: hypothetical protein GX750_04525 [Clostridia bacterium]|nr:hypothetical protein [Clostridia bacterium]